MVISIDRWTDLVAADGVVDLTRTDDRSQPSSLARVERRGKHLWCDGQPFHVRGVTYGSFGARDDGAHFPETSKIDADLAAMRELGINCLRTYELPPDDLLDLLGHHGLRVLVGLHYRGWRMEPGTDRAARRRVRDAGRAAADRAMERLAGRAEVLGVAVGNEIPVDLVRLHGRRAVESSLSDLVTRLHDGAPELLTTYVNFPTTEFLEVPEQDLISMNVFLEDQAAFDRYLQHLQIVSVDRPVLVSELGLASEIHGEQAQAEHLDAQLRGVDEAGLAGAFVYAWTDDWVVAGEQVEGWGFGITDERRRPKPAAQAVFDWTQRQYPTDLRTDWPRISVVVCAYNEEATIGACVDSVLASPYPDLELIVCDDGSTDATADIVRRSGAQLLELDHGGLSRARNRGCAAATGEIVAYLDADASCHPHWPFHLALSLEDPQIAATGGPNLPCEDVGFSERAIAHVPGQACEVLLGPNRAEHVPGCNMAFRKAELEAIGGFDVRYTSAGDDVDVCWKLLDRKSEIGFAPAAQVDHHRRSTVKGFLRQQRGYGRAERMLAGPHRHRLNGLGQARWSGFVYGPGAFLPSILRSTVYTGWSGQAPFQPAISHRAHVVGGLVAAVLPVVVVAGILCSVVALFAPIAALGAVAALGLLALVAVNAALVAQVPGAERRPYRMRAIVGLLSVAQPLARSWGRFLARPLDAGHDETPEWTGDRASWIEHLQEVLQRRGLRATRGGLGAFHDLRVANGGPVHARVTLAVVWSWEPRVCVRFRVSPPWAVGGVVALVASFSVSAVAALAATGAMAVIVLANRRALDRALRASLAMTAAPPTS